jgi:PAS domain S-box-containing protein
LTPFLRFEEGGESSFQPLWDDGERVLWRGWLLDDAGQRKQVLAVLPAAEHPTRASLDRLAHEYSLKEELDELWSLRPLELVRSDGRTMLLLQDPGGEPLEARLGAPMDVGRFLRLAVPLAAAVGRMHDCDLIHKDLKPAHILVNDTTGAVRLTGFGIASRLPREHQPPEPPEVIAGTLAYMAPEQTGRMNRSIDSRSDLYALGVTLYRMLTGSLPFNASDPMEWVHCHIARKPVAPAERLTELPRVISAIVMKLLAKTAEERYQAAAGLESDLRRCLDQWEGEHRCDDFQLGQRDTPDRLLIPETLYGREREIETLLAAFSRIVEGGAPELVLVSGYSGIGKSSVVHELHKMLVPPRGLFAAGKFDQYKRDIPYSTLAQAFQGLIRPLLGKSESDIAPWRDALLEALGPNGNLIADLVPELKLIIGEQPAVPELPHEHAKGRFQLVFRRFLGVFARPGQPLVLFLDDLQWLDAATLDGLEDLLTRPDLRSLLLIGAYRDNEVSSAHPLMRKLDAIRKAGAQVQEIVLAPLAREDLGRLIADSFRCDPERAAPLAQLVHEKTAGNPFFAIQFLSALVEERLVTFDHVAAGWSWDLHRIHAKGYTDNVVDLMVGKLSRLPANTQNALRQLACLGDHADSALLAIVCERSKEELHAHLQEALQTGLVLYSDGAYRFLHDRVQEAAYFLIPASERPATHLRIGRLLASRIAPAELEDKIFELVSQLNRASHLVTSIREREQAAKLNLMAARRAKMSTAYASALAYLAAGRALLSEETWDSNHALIFAVEFQMAECELLTADMPAAEDRLIKLAPRARGVQDIGAVARLRLTLYTTLDRSDRGVEVCLEYLKRGRTDWPPHPSIDEVRCEYDRIWFQLGSRSIEDLVDLPLMEDEEAVAALDVLTEVVTPALFTDERLLALVICRMVNLSLEHGNSDGSCFAYVWLGMIAGPHFGNYEAGFRFGRLGNDLVEHRGLRRFEARTCMSFGNLVMPWTRHVKSGRDLVRRAFETANNNGDLTFAAYSRNNLNTNLLAAGDPLDDVQREVEYGLEFAEKARFGLVIDIIKAQLQLVRTLRGLIPRFGCLDDAQFDELGFERHLAGDPRLALPECWYWIRKLQARFFAGEYPVALDASMRAEGLLWTSPSFFEMAEFHFYSGLCHAGACDSAPRAEHGRHVEALAAHHRQLRIWAEHCPENFENRATVLGAELARLEGRALDAGQLYEEAIRSAHRGGFVHNEAIAYERASAFYRTRGFEEFAELYLRNARYGYLRWGAEGKVRQLDQLYPHLRNRELGWDRTGTIVAPVEHLDLATVIKVSQAVAGEIVPEKLIDTIMRTAIEHAGACRGLLILSRDGAHRIAAEATEDGDAVTVQLRDEAVTPEALPASVLHYVLRTRDSLVLDDAAAAAPFAADPYVSQNQARSVLALPLLNQAKLIGVLYLENNLTSRVFAPARIPVLKLLTSEAGISLENTRLYRDLASREARIRRLVDANIIGIMIWDLEGRIIEANEAFLRIVGYDQEDLISGRIRWTDLTPPEWADRDLGEWMSKLKKVGSLQPYEKEYWRKDGARVPVLIGAVSFEERGDQGVAFVLDLTEQKRAEAEARESERRYREVYLQLAHANRVASMGQLSASIAHEVNQPIAAATTNAQAALRWLDAQPPDLEEVRQALCRIVANASRAGDVIGRIRALIKKAPPQREALDINERILEVIALTRGEMAKIGVSLRTEFADGLPLIQGDHVELQQVMLNLILNAIEAMSSVKDGFRELRISAEIDACGGVLVSIGDSGPGLSPESMESLFEPFYTTKAEGMGMGLAISRSIIVAHGGQMWASANERRGAVLQFTLPAESADGVAGSDAYPQPE